MKSFLELYEEKNATHNPVVMAFGRMNPPTTGHLKLIDKVRSEAEKRGAKHTIIVSHSQDSKKNPLSAAQKLKHLKRYSPGTHFESSSSEFPTFLHHAARLYAKGHDHLIMVAGSDRVKEYQRLLNQYNGHKGRHGFYNFQKIEVISAGHRDPDAEGAEGMSGTKMREHAQHNNFAGFREGVPHHVSDKHTKELMHDVRQGMGLNEEYDRGQFKAIFVTGGPGSGKDVIIREAIASEKATELNFTQVCDILNDKHKLAMKSMNPRNESVRNRGPLIINGPADDNERIAHIKEELEELGYDTMMVFVGTNNETSQHRNSLLTRMMVESVRQDKWLKAQKNTKYFIESFTNFISFDNTGDLNTKEEDITDIYQKTKMFLDANVVSESALDWIHRNGSLRNKFNIIGEENVKSNSKSIQGKTVGKYNPFYRAARPSDIPADNRAGDPNADNIKWDGGKKRGSYIFRTYEEKSPTLKINPPPKEPNFQKDNDKEKRLKRGDKSGSTSRVGRPDGIGSTWSTRTNGTGLTGGAGLGNQTYSEDKQIISKIKSKRSTGGGQEYSNAAPSTTAFPAGQAIGNNFVGEKKDFKKFRESIDSPGEVAMGVGGTLMGATNKEPMETYGDKNRMGILIDKKKKKKGAK